MYNIKLQDVVKCYETIKKQINKKYKKQDIDKVIDLTDSLALVVEKFNWIFCDYEIEKLLQIISNKYVIKSATNNSDIRKIVFYDQIGSTECLGLQYLRSLMYYNFEILYIFESSTRTCSKILLDELIHYQKAKIIIVDSSKNNKIHEINNLYKEIIIFNPHKAILHSPAEGAFGVILWNALSQIERYRIVPGDHHFYLGILCVDYFFEFRRFGFTTATDKRLIDKNSIYIQPYYPISDNSFFDGFPVDISNKIIIFTAGALYKIYGENEIFFYILKKLLSDNPQIIIFLAGDGSFSPIINFIKENRFEDRLILLGYRKDLNLCIANSDIYLSTFPLTGALTSQFAASYSKPILSYTSEDLCVNYIDDILGDEINQDNHKVTFTNLDDFFIYANKLINDSDFRAKEGYKVNKSLTTKTNFDTNLLSILNKENQKRAIEKLEINFEKSVKININIENKYVPNLKYYLLKKFHFNFFLLFPRLIIPTFFSLFFYKFIIEKYLYKTKRKQYLFLSSDRKSSNIFGINYKK